MLAIGRGIGADAGILTDARSADGFPVVGAGAAAALALLSHGSGGGTVQLFPALFQS